MDRSWLRVRELVGRSPGLRRRFVVAVLLGALSGATAVLGLAAIAGAVGALSAARPSGGAVTAWVLAGLVGLLASFTLAWLADGVAHRASYALELVLRRAIADALARLPLGTVTRIGAGRVKKVMLDDVKALHNAVADALPFVGSGLAKPAVAILVLGFVQWRLLLVALVLVPVALYCLWLLTRDYGEQMTNYGRANEDVNAAVVEFAQGMPVVRAFDDGTASFGRFAASVRAFTAALEPWLRTSYTPGRLNALFIVPLPTLAVIAAGGVPMLAAGWVSVPELVLALLIGSLPVEAVSPFMHLNNHLNESRAGAVRVSELLELPVLAEPAQPREPVDGSVELRGVSFGYGGDRAGPALDGVDITVPAGTVCALVGPSGAGKSTVARLVPRFHDVDAGAVLVGGVDVREIASQTLLAHVALVFQEPFLVDDTIAANIRLGRPDASDDEVRAATRAAAAHTFVEALPGGYGYRVGERGGRLSGGQRQRITIARVILSRAPVVVLDEATAFADPENEVAIQEAVSRLTDGRTVIVIAHRLSTIVDVDQIVVLDGGRVVERGRHPELVAAGGRYARLWEHHGRAAAWGLGGARLAGGAR